MSSVLNITVESTTLVRILALGFTAFGLAMLITPLYTTLAYKYQWWKKPRETTTTGEKAKIFTALHAEKHRRHIPTMAGIIAVISVAIVTLLFNFSRLTYLPLLAMVGAGGIGLIDDIINLKGNGSGVAGMRTKMKFMSILTIAIVGGLYFYFRLDYHTIHMPLQFLAHNYTWDIGWLMIPLFALVIVATANAVNISDGLDGLAGGLLVSAFAAFAVIAFFEQKYGVAGFCVAMIGALLSYVWFNIFPARFFMGDVGSFAFGTALGVVAMLTDTVVLLPIIGIVFVAEAGSSSIQIMSKKLRNGKKVFKIAPIHHHFEALGWPEAKVTMRFWVIGQVAAVIGLTLFMLGHYL